MPADLGKWRANIQDADGNYYSHIIWGLHAAGVIIDHYSEETFEIIPWHRVYTLTRYMLPDERISDHV